MVQKCVLLSRCAKLVETFPQNAAAVTAAKGESAQSWLTVATTVMHITHFCFLLVQKDVKTWTTSHTHTHKIFTLVY